MAEEILAKKNFSLDIEEFEDFERRVDLVQDQIKALVKGEGLINLSTEINLISESKKNECIKPTKTISNTSKQHSSTSDKNSGHHEMSKDAFMRSIEADANRRYQQKLERKEKLVEAKTSAEKHFRLEDFASALLHYNKAIELDNRQSNLYVDRAVVHLKLCLFLRTIQDCDAALKLKDSLKPRLLKARALWESGKESESEEVISMTMKDYPKNEVTIKNYTSTWRKMEK